MARTRKRVCDVTGVNTSEKNFYTNQSHTKAVQAYNEFFVNGEGDFSQYYISKTL